jgi:hypothetical protein
MGAMDGATATQQQRQWTTQRRCKRGNGDGAMRRVNGKWRHVTQGEGNATKGDATTSHRSEQEANERRKAQVDKRWRGDDKEGHVVLLSGGGGSAVLMGADGDTQGILRRRVRPTGDGDGRRRRGW